MLKCQFQNRNALCNAKNYLELFLIGHLPKASFRSFGLFKLNKIIIFVSVAGFKLITTESSLLPKPVTHVIKQFGKAIEKKSTGILYASSSFLKMGHPRPLNYLFSVFFKQTIQILQQMNVEKCPSSFRFWDSNSRPSDY